MANDPLLVDLALPFYPALRPAVWARMRSFGPRWRGAILRAGAGLTGDGPRLTEHADAIRGAGLELGAYWYLIVGQDPTAQADAFAHELAVMRPTLRPVVDVERAGNERASAAQATAWTRTFVARLRERTGQAAVLYAGEWLRGLVGAGARHLGCDLLWLPSYTPHPQGYYEPMGFALAEVPLWQYAGAGPRGVACALPGFPRTTPIGPVDISVELTPGAIDRLRWT